jgi:hypothetical protein
MKTLSKWAGRLCIALVFGLGIAMIAYPAAVTQIAGLAVAQSATQWNQLKDMAQGDAQSNGVALFSPCLWNGTTCDRARSGGAADGQSTTGISGANPSLFNGATFDRARSASATNNTSATSLGAAYVTPLSTWFQTSTPAANTQATTSKAAGGGTVRHVATSITWCFATDTAVGAGPFNINLRDGATGAGTIIRTWIVDLPAVENSQCQDLSGLNMTGTANTAMTLEFAAAGGAATVETVTLTGYSTP